MNYFPSLSTRKGAPSVSQVQSYGLISFNGTGTGMHYRTSAAAHATEWPHAFSSNRIVAGLAQERNSAAQEQGRDRGGSAMLRNSMSEPTYFQRSSIADPEYNPNMGRPRGMVTPQVNVAEGEPRSSPALHAKRTQPCPAACSPKSITMLAGHI